MKKGTAYDFWKSYIGLYTKNGASVKMENPAVDFTRRAKAGDFDEVSDEEYYKMLDEIEELSSLWKRKKESTVENVLQMAIKNTPLEMDEVDALAEILSTASERQTYRYVEPEKNIAKSDANASFEAEKREWTPRKIYEYLDEYVYRQEKAKKAAAIMLYNHLQGRRRNMILAGPTGCGKTEIWRTLQKKFSFIKIVNGPQLACDGWKGSYHVKDIFLGEPGEKVNKMLVVIDEAETDDITVEDLIAYGNVRNAGKRKLSTFTDESRRWMPAVCGVIKKENEKRKREGKPSRKCNLARC